MQLGAVLVFDAGPLQLRHGGIDVERLRAYTAMRLPAVPRARERRARFALGGLEVFVEDPSFQLEYHVRHASLPRPGDERALKRLAARVFSQALDPDKPLWELWIVEGLEDSRFALIAKCDAALLEAGASAGGTFARATEELLSRVGSLARPSRLIQRVAGGVRVALDFAEVALAPAAAPLGRGDGGGAHRRIDWLALASADVAAIRGRLGGSVRDVVLAALAGGLRRVFERRGASSDTGAIRVLTPICVGGRLESPRLRLPIEASDARARLVSLRAAGERLPAGDASAGASPLHQLATLSGAVDLGRRADVVAVELDGPPSDSSVLGARLRAIVPVLPSFEGCALGVTVTRLGERIFVGLSADASRLPDLSALTDGMAAAFDELRRAAAEPAAKRGAARGGRPRARRRAEAEVR